jgi:N-acyl-D-amino-acid deacylase
MMPMLPLLLLLQTGPADSVDVLVRGGMVHDGGGGPARRVDVGILGDRIVFLGTATPARPRAARTIDATGLLVAPGFIDPHTHSYEGLPFLSEERRKNAGALMQGVTTVVTGADGRGPLDVAHALAEAEQRGIGVNTYALAGFGTVRSRVMGNSSAPATPAQIDSMKALIAKAMSEGAFGVGSGLFYAPQSYASTEEVIAVLKGATPYGGVYDTHQRDESSYTIGLLNSVREAIRIGRETGLTTNLGHVKALGVDVWGYADSVLALMREARAAGHMVVADQYPWTASGTSLGSSLLPRWSQAGGRDSLLLRIADSATRVRILAEMRENLRRRGGDSTLLITSGAAGSHKGKTLRQVAAERRAGAVETALELIATMGDLGVASFNMTERDIETFMRDPFVMTGRIGRSPPALRHLPAEDPALRARQTGDQHGADDPGLVGPGGRGLRHSGAGEDPGRLPRRCHRLRSGHHPGAGDLRRAREALHRHAMGLRQRPRRSPGRSPNRGAGRPSPPEAGPDQVALPGPGPGDIFAPGSPPSHSTFEAAPCGTPPTHRSASWAPDPVG